MENIFFKLDKKSSNPFIEYLDDSRIDGLPIYKINNKLLERKYKINKILTGKYEEYNLFDDLRKETNGQIYQIFV
jgi:hypothetical protein